MKMKKRKTNAILAKCIELRGVFFQLRSIIINPWKNELGKVSKNLIEQITSNVISEIHFNQWRTTDSLLQWFSDSHN